MQGSEYENAIARLIERTAQAHKAHGDKAHGGYDFTAERKAIEALAQRLDDVAEDLGCMGGAQEEIEAAHDASYGFATYEADTLRLRALAESARTAAAGVPDARRKFALPFAALAFLFVRWRCGLKPPTLYDEHADVVEFERVCNAAGIFLDRGTLRRALARATRAFDPTLAPQASTYDNLFR